MTWEKIRIPWRDEPARYTIPGVVHRHANGEVLTPRELVYRLRGLHYQARDHYHASVMTLGMLDKTVTDHLRAEYVRLSDEADASAEEIIALMRDQDADA